MWADEKDGMGNRILCTAVRKNQSLLKSMTSVKIKAGEDAIEVIDEYFRQWIFERERTR